MRACPLRVFVTLALVALASLAWRVLCSQAPPSTLEVPWIESLRPGAFDDQSHPVLDEWAVAYRIDATVFVPLLFTSIPIVSRDAVGIGSFTAWDSPEDANARVRAYEFFAVSFPERARGLNRLGLVREVVRLTPEGAGWTAHFGVISADWETHKGAGQALDQSEDIQRYSIIDGLIRARQAENSMLHLNVPGRWTTSAALYDEVRRRWEGQEPDFTRELSNPDRRTYSEPLGFLGGLQSSLRAVAADLANGEDPRKHHRYQGYVHNGRVLRFELRAVDLDPGRAKGYAQAGWLADPTALRRLEYRILDDRGDELERFKLWVELAARRVKDPFAAPLVPIAFELEPRAYLLLRAVRVSGRSAAAGHRSDRTVLPDAPGAYDRCHTPLAVRASRACG